MFLWFALGWKPFDYFSSMDCVMKEWKTSIFGHQFFISFPIFLSPSLCASILILPSLTCSISFLLYLCYLFLASISVYLWININSTFSNLLYLVPSLSVLQHIKSIANFVLLYNFSILLLLLHLKPFLYVPSFLFLCLSLFIMNFVFHPEVWLPWSAVNNFQLVFHSFHFRMDFLCQTVDSFKFFLNLN